MSKTKEKIIGEFKQKIIRELKAIGFKRRETGMILNITSLPLIDALSLQIKEIRKAWEIPGPRTDLHDRAKVNLRIEWPALFCAIVKMLNEDAI